VCVCACVRALIDSTYKEGAASLYPLAHTAHNHGFVAAIGQTCAADCCFYTCSDTSSHCANGKQMCERQSGWSKRQRWRRMRTLTTLTSTLTTTKMVTFILAHPLSCLEVVFVNSFLPHASSCRCFHLLHWVWRIPVASTCSSCCACLRRACSWWGVWARHARRPCPGMACCSSRKAIDRMASKEEWHPKKNGIQRNALACLMHHASLSCSHTRQHDMTQ